MSDAGRRPIEMGGMGIKCSVRVVRRSASYIAVGGTNETTYSCPGGQHRDVFYCRIDLSVKNWYDLIIMKAQWTTMKSGQHSQTNHGHETKRRDQVLDQEVVSGPACFQLFRTKLSHHPTIPIQYTLMGQGSPTEHPRGINVVKTFESGSSQTLKCGLVRTVTE